MLPVLRAQLGGQQEAAVKLLALADMVNQAVGDALSGLLLVEAALRRKAWGVNRVGGAVHRPAQPPAQGEHSGELGDDCKWGKLCRQRIAPTVLAMRWSSMHALNPQTQPC